MEIFRCPPRAPRSGLVVVWVLLLVAVLGLLGFLGSTQVSSTRRLLERSHARTLLLVVADSAFEEASARLTQIIGPIPVPVLGEKRDLSSRLPTSLSIDPESTRAAFERIGVKLDSVDIKSGDWKLAVTRATGGGRQIHEIGILEFSVMIHILAGGTSFDRRVVVRRYAEARGIPSANGALLVPQPYNLALDVRER